MANLASDYSLRPGGGLRRRRIVNKIMESLGWGAALIAVAVLVVVVASVAVRAWPALNVDFFTKPPNLFGGPGGGISSAIIGSAIIVGIATAIALPVGHSHRHLPHRVRAPVGGTSDPARARCAERSAHDHHRHFRLRATRHRPHSRAPTQELWRWRS